MMNDLGQWIAQHQKEEELKDAKKQEFYVALMALLNKMVGKEKEQERYEKEMAYRMEKDKEHRKLSEKQINAQIAHQKAMEGIAQQRTSQQQPRESAFDKALANQNAKRLIEIQRQADKNPDIKYYTSSFREAMNKANIPGWKRKFPFDYGRDKLVTTHDTDAVAQMNEANTNLMGMIKLFEKEGQVDRFERQLLQNALPTPMKSKELNEKGLEYIEMKSDLIAKRAAAMGEYLANHNGSLVGFDDPYKQLSKELDDRFKNSNNSQKKSTDSSEEQQIKDLLTKMTEQEPTPDVAAKSGEESPEEGIGQKALSFGKQFGKDTIDTLSGISEGLAKTLTLGHYKPKGNTESTAYKAGEVVSDIGQLIYGGGLVKGATKLAPWLSNILAASGISAAQNKDNRLGGAATGAVAGAIGEGAGAALGKGMEYASKGLKTLKDMKALKGKTPAQALGESLQSEYNKVYDPISAKYNAIIEQADKAGVKIKVENLPKEVVSVANPEIQLIKGEKDHLTFGDLKDIISEIEGEIRSIDAKLTIGKSSSDVRRATHKAEKRDLKAARDKLEKFMEQVVPKELLQDLKNTNIAFREQIVPYRNAPGVSDIAGGTYKYHKSLPTKIREGEKTKLANFVNTKLTPEQRRLVELDELMQNADKPVTQGNLLKELLKKGGLPLVAGGIGGYQTHDPTWALLSALAAYKAPNAAKYTFGNLHNLLKRGKSDELLYKYLPYLATKRGLEEE